MILLHRDPRGKSLFTGHTITSSSTDSLSQGNSLQSHYAEQIENLRRRIRELESLNINQPCSSTESSREKEIVVESTNPCFMRQLEGGRKDNDHELGECECFPLKQEPTQNGDEKSKEGPLPEMDANIGQSGAEDCMSEQGADSKSTGSE